MKCTVHGKVLPHYNCLEAEQYLDHFETHLAVDVTAPTVCRARTGVIWKLGGEVCSCIRQADHGERDHPAGAWHVCSCNAWFDDSCVQWRPDSAVAKDPGE